MTLSSFIGGSTWISILAIIFFGVLSGVIDNNFTTWFLFSFLCLIGLIQWSEKYSKRK